MIAAVCLVLAGGSPGAQEVGEKVGEKVEKKAEPHEVHGGPYEKCSRACTHCLRECESCVLHCAKLLAEGKRDHQRTLGTCLDCSEFCAAAARVTAHHGPMSTLVCEACAKACDICGKACEKFKEDQHMERCAKACRDCAAACRTMIQEVRPKHQEPATDKDKKGE
jgi:hypothetical protein